MGVLVRVFHMVLDQMEQAFRKLEASVSAPIKLSTGRGFTLRYKEKSPHQMLLQKFARLISGLHSLEILNKAGYIQEQCVIQRSLDEIEEDIIFICIGIIYEDWTDHHKRYEEYFWMEEPGQPTVRRHKIRAYVNRHSGEEDLSTAKENGKLLYKTYSGYAHAASANVMEMCFDDPPLYRLAGQIHSPLYQDHVNDLWNYYYRGLIAIPYMAKAFGNEQLGEESLKSLRAFEKVFSREVLPAAK